MPGNRNENGHIVGLHGLLSCGAGFLACQERQTGISAPRFREPFSKLLPPCLLLLPDLIAATFFPISGPSSKLVLFSYFVSGQEILKVPRGVSRLSFLVHAAPTGRLREANPLRSV